MSEYTEEQYQSLPDFAKPDYEKVGEVYKHSGMIKVKNTANDLDGKLKKATAEGEATATALKDFQDGEAKKLEDARNEALKKANTSGDVEAINKEHEQQMEDLRKRTTDEVTANVTKEFEEKGATAKAKLIAAEMAATYAVDSDARDMLREYFEGKVKIDTTTGKEVFYGDDGRALSLDRAGFESEVIKKSKRLARLVKSGVVTDSGGFVEGSQDARGGFEENKQAQEAIKKGDLNGFLKAAIKPNVQT